MGGRYPTGMLLLLGLLCLASLGISLVSGSVQLTAAQVWDALWSPGNDLASQVIHQLRLPRSLAALTTGGLLALAGCLMQVLVRNPLADPYIGYLRWCLGGRPAGDADGHRRYRVDRQRLYRRTGRHVPGVCPLPRRRTMEQ